MLIADFFIYFITMGKSKKKGGGGGGGGQRKPHQTPAQPTDEFPSLGNQS